MRIDNGHFDTWPEASGTTSTIFTAFMLTINREVNNRAVKAQKARESKLFREKAPTSVMLNTE